MNLTAKNLMAQIAELEAKLASVEMPQNIPAEPTTSEVAPATSAKADETVQTVVASNPPAIPGASETTDATETQYGIDVPADDKPVIDPAKFDDKRNEIGMPEKTASCRQIYATANNATRLATIVLGSKAPEHMIEAQAMDFLALGDSRISSALKRYNATKHLYAEDTATAPAVPGANPQPAAVEKMIKEDEKCVASAVKADETPAPAPVPAPVVAEEVPAPAPEETPADDMDMLINGDEMNVEFDPVSPEGEFEVNFDEVEGDNMEIENEDDMDALFESQVEMPEVTEAPQPTASKKAGIKKLGGQPKMASNMASDDDVAGLWDDVPNVEVHF